MGGHIHHNQPAFPSVLVLNLVVHVGSPVEGPSFCSDNSGDSDNLVAKINCPTAGKAEKLNFAAEGGNSDCFLLSPFTFCSAPYLSDTSKVVKVQHRCLMQKLQLLCASPT
jgi:hypothetical protein